MSRSVKAKSSLPKKTKTIGLPFGPNHPYKGGAPKGSQNHLVSGHYARKKALTRWGFDALDKRYKPGREFAERREQIYADLGGKDACSQIRLDLVERYMRLCVLIDSLDSWIFQQPSLINKRKRCVLPIVRERAALEESALRLASAIGIERKPKPVPTLAEYLDSDDFDKDRMPTNSKPNGRGQS